MMKKRINYIDIARAFAMIFIVLGHTIVHSEHCGLIFKFLYSFHVVLFFIISGFTFNVKSDQSFFSFFKNKFIRIMIPYFIWALFFLIPYMLFGSNVGNSLGTESSFDLKTQIMNVFYGNGDLSALKQNSSLWFLPALFSMEIIYYFIVKLSSNKRYLDILTVSILLLVAYLSSGFLSIIFPWGINTVLNLGIFFYIGYLFKKYNLFDKDSKLFKWYIILLMFIIGLIACFMNKTHVQCIDYEYGYFTLALLSGLCLSICVVWLSSKISKNKVLEYIGRNTMGILIFHKLIVLIFQTKLGFISKLLSNSNIIIEFGIALLVVTLSIVCSLIGTEIVKKVLPICIGEHKVKN